MSRYTAIVSFQQMQALVAALSGYPAAFCADLHKHAPDQLRAKGHIPDGDVKAAIEASLARDECGHEPKTSQTVSIQAAPAATRAA